MTIGIALAVLLGLAACGGGNRDELIDPNSGRIAGNLQIVGPYDPAANLQLQLLFRETGGPVTATQAPVGRLPAAVTAFYLGRSIEYSFSELFVGLYVIEVYSGSGAAKRVHYTSTTLEPDYNGRVRAFSGQFSFTGPAPFGRAQGEVLLSGAWPAGRNVFLGFTRAGDNRLLRWPVDQAAVVAGSLPFDVGGLSNDTYTLGLFSSDSAGGDIIQHGVLPEQLVVPSGQTVAGLEFNASFDAPPA